MKYVIPLCLTCILKALGIVHNKLLCTEKTKQNTDWEVEEEIMDGSKHNQIGRCVLRCDQVHVSTNDKLLLSHFFSRPFQEPANISADLGTSR